MWATNWTLSAPCARRATHWILNRCSVASWRSAMSATVPPVDELRRLLYTPVLSDVLDSFGLMRQALRPFVRPLDETLVLLGRVRTGRYEVAGATEPGR